MRPVEEKVPDAAGLIRPGTLRGREGYFRAGQDKAGQWWLVDPAGNPFFAKGVNGVRAVGGEGVVAFDPAARLRQWGFNAAGVGGDRAGPDDGLAFLATVDFCRSDGAIVAPGVRLPDVFDPGWPGRAAARALAVCPAEADNSQLIGWVTDNVPGWGQRQATGRPTLLQTCLSLEPGHAAYHAAWEFVLALHGGRIEGVARAWGVSLANREVVRELTRSEQGLTTRGYGRDEVRWMREFARRYFSTTAAAVRAADPNHLVLGCRFGEPVGAAILAECVHPAVDAALPDWRDLSGPGARAVGPVMAGNVCWSGKEFWREGARGTRLTSVERMLRRGRAALDRTARHPAVTGYFWVQWMDERGEQPPFARGLVHGNGIEAREHTELLARFNRRADALRRAAAALVLS